MFNHENHLYLTFVNLLANPSKEFFMRPLGKGVKGDSTFWDRMYPMQVTNTQLVQQTQLVSIHKTESIKKGMSPSIRSICGGGFTWDNVMKTDDYNIPCFMDIKVMERSLLFNGNDSTDLFCGSEDSMYVVFDSLNTGRYSGVMCFLEQRVRQGQVYYYCHSLNITKIIERMCVFTDYEENRVIEQGEKTGQVKTFLERYSVIGSKNETGYTHDNAFVFCSKEKNYRIRVKPSSIASWSGRRTTSKQVRGFLRQNNLLSTCRFYGGKNPCNAQQVYESIMSVV